MMKAPIAEGAPPGYLTVNEVLTALSMSRQNFYVSGLVEALPRWSVGGVLLFRCEDVGKLAEWLAFRRARHEEGDRRYLRLAPAWVRDLDHAMDIVEAWEEAQESTAALPADEWPGTWPAREAFARHRRRTGGGERT